MKSSFHIECLVRKGPEYKKRGWDLLSQPLFLTFSIRLRSSEYFLQVELLYFQFQPLSHHRRQYKI